MKITLAGYIPQILIIIIVIIISIIIWYSYRNNARIRWIRVYDTMD